MPVNCAALPSELLESEMFGHRRGAFTGAVREQPGLLETADERTLFLDELAEMPLGLQAVDNGELREDLFYRLRVVPIELPPLRERREDIPVLVRHFMSRWWSRYRGSDGPSPKLTPEAMDALFRHPWPGNVRELENTMEQLVIFAEPDSQIHPGDLPRESLTA